MKKFKELAEQIGLYEDEHTFGGGVQNPSGTPREISATSDEGAYYIQRKSQLNRINAFLDAFSRKEYIDPKGALAMLRAKLNITGLDFEFNAKTCFNEEGQNVFPVTRFGGTFGKSLDTPFDEFETTDGISEYNDGKGFSLVIDITPTANGVMKLNAKLVETAPAVIAVKTDDEGDDED
jgi:hypothetical protein|tara:strand:- start:580 stop:1116 length:537 start_codon:yes stop_codon:yes gene_type:complete